MSFEWLKANLEALVLMILFSIMGGAAQYIRKIQAKKALFSVTELIGEVVVSAFSGLLAGLALIDHASMPVTLMCVGVAAHMGTRFVYAIEAAVTSRIRGSLTK